MYPLEEPFRTGAYWDDIAYLGLMTIDHGKLAVLGGGLLSFMSLLRSKLKNNLQINSIEINQEVTSIAKKIQKDYKHNSQLSLTYSCQNVLDIPHNYFADLDSLFIDIYNEFEISEIAIDPKFLLKIKVELPRDAIVAININDNNFGPTSKCASRLFFESIKRHWENILLVRRSSSTTLFFSSAKSVKQLKEALVLVNSNASEDYLLLEDATKFFVEQKIKNFDMDLLKFKNDFNKNILQENTLLYSVINDLQSLSPMDILKLLKKGKAFEE